MDDKFEVGEVAVFQPVSMESVSPSMVVCIGMECEILSGIIYHPRAACYVYIVRMADGDKAYVQPINLRKKKPPKEDASWAAEQYRTNWQPSSAPVKAPEHASHSVE